MKHCKLITLTMTMLLTCFHSTVAYTLNNPYPKADQEKNYLYTTFMERPKTLDPARSFSVTESIFISQVYEPPLQYHYLKRPLQLVPRTLESMPTITYLDKNNKPIPASSTPSSVAYSLYTLKLKKGIKYQYHPAFATNAKGKSYYLNLSQDARRHLHIRALRDFHRIGTRELVARDYVYQIKRLASPKSQSPILGLMSQYIVGLSDLSKQLEKAYKHKQGFFDLRKFKLQGVKAIDKYTYQIKIKGVYPQFQYWLAMSFFSPIPWEADRFYSELHDIEHNINFDWYPVGTGPYKLIENNPNRRMVLARNQNFSADYYPTSGEPSDKAAGLLVDAGKRLPFVDKVIFMLERESIPAWSKFLQGYYDTSGIGSDSFDQAIHIDDNGKPGLTKAMQKKNMLLRTTVTPGIFYLGFNMLDPIVGGKSERARHLRLAISIALDYSEFIQIFLNGRGQVADGPVPPDIQGSISVPNSFVYAYLDGDIRRLPLAKAKEHMIKAGYPNGRDKKTGKPLVLNYDAIMQSGPDDKARFDWMRKQFAKLGIQLHVRATQYNRFQRKIRQGESQLFFWGWSADYPDAENFLALLYGKNAKVKYGGENVTNYHNPKYDALFEKMKTMMPGPKRQAVIREMLPILYKDSPWIYGFYPKAYTLAHEWYRVTKPSSIIQNTMKYIRIDPIKRRIDRDAWNQPLLWPLALLFLVLFIFALIPTMAYLRRVRNRKTLVEEN